MQVFYHVYYLRRNTWVHINSYKNLVEAQDAAVRLRERDKFDVEIRWQLEQSSGSISYFGERDEIRNQDTC